jgi:hypothetical protein
MTTSTYLTAQEIAELLDEPKVFLVQRAIRVIGSIRLEAILHEALRIEADGGMLTEDKSRRRTPGGTLFALMRQALSYRERARLFGVGSPSPGMPPRLSCTWTDVQQSISALSHTTPEEATMKLTLVGRPGPTQTRGQAVIFQLKGKAPPSLPKELPALPQTPPLTWTVMVSMRQWNKVKASLEAHPDDRLVIDGYPTLQEGQHILLASNCVSVAMQRAQKEQQRATQEADGLHVKKDQL